MNILRYLMLAILLVIPFSASQADEIKPGYLEWTEIQKDEWRVTWKVPQSSRLAGIGELVIPQNCNPIAEKRVQFSDVARTTITRFNCEGGLAEQTLGISGFAYDDTDALVRIAALGADVRTVQLSASAPTITLSAEAQIGNVAGTHFVMGAEHILAGYDHLLFVVALVLLLRTERTGSLGRIAGAVTAFTIAHSITLAASTLGHISLPGWPVEVTIALSIIFLAGEIVKSGKGKVRLSERLPWITAFLFGLLHGFGFAGALADIGLPQDDVPMALLTFNLGVEAGQLLVVAIAFVMLKLILKFAENSYPAVRRILAYAIGIIACFWFIERIAGF